MTADAARDVAAQAAAVLAEHRLVWENDGGDYGGRSWFECSHDADNVMGAEEFPTVADHEAHQAAALAATGLLAAVALDGGDR